MRILIVNLHSSLNLGDLAITTETLRQLHASFPNAHVTLAMTDPVSHVPVSGEQVVGSFASFITGIDSQGDQRWNKRRALSLALLLMLCATMYRAVGVKPWKLLPSNLQATLDAYATADLVLSCGGGNILYARKAWSIAFTWSVITQAYAFLLGKPLAMLPQSVGPFATPLQRRVTRWLVERMAVVMVREPRSVETLYQLGVRRPVLLIPDLAFRLEPADSAEAEMLLAHYLPATHNGPRVAFTLMDWHSLNAGFQRQAVYEAAIVDAIHHVVEEQGGEVVLFAQVLGPTYREDDRRVTERVYRRVQHLPNVAYVTDQTTPQLLKAAYGRMDLLVGIRMHSLILALGCHVPCINIAYMPKSAGTMQMAGLDPWSITIDQLSPEGLIDRIDAALTQQSTLRATITRRVTRIQQAAGQAGPTLADWLRFQR